MLDGFVRSQKDTAGITTTATRAYTAGGMVLTQTDGRVNTTTTVTDITGRTTSVTDADNSSLVGSSTGIWAVQYNAENHPVSFTNGASNTVVECTYDSMGRRATKKVITNGSVTSYLRFIYRGYLQIAAIDAISGTFQWFLVWDPSQSPRGLGGGLDKARSGFAPQGRAGNGVPASQPIATRPLAIRKDGTWYAYGWDQTKNICEVFGPVGYIRTTYTYTPYGEVTATGDVTQPIQWSSEFNDSELVLVYYNYRHYNPVDGRWTTKDPVKSNALLNYYWGIVNAPIYHMDYLGLELAARICRREARQNTRCGRTGKKMCMYYCECPPGYVWSDLGTGSQYITRPCSDPDIVESGTCTQRNRWDTITKRKRIPQIESVHSNMTSEALYIEYRMGNQGALNLGTGVAVGIVLIVGIVLMNVFTPVKIMPV